MTLRHIRKPPKFLQPVLGLPDRIGRRGAFLLIMGGLFITLGIAYMPSNSVAAPIAPQLRWITGVIPLGAFAWAWIVFGAYLCFIGLFRASAGLTHTDGSAFIIGQAMPTVWAVVWAVAYFERHYDPHRVVAGHVSPGIARDAPRGLVNFAIFLAFSLLFLIVAGMLSAQQVLGTIPETEGGEGE